LIPGEISERLTSAPIAWFSTVRPDRSPHTVPVWFVHDENDLWVASSSTSAKVWNIRHHNEVSVAIDGSASRPLVALGRASILEVHKHPDVAWSFAEKYHGFDITVGSVAESLILVRLSITRWLLDGSPG
jgi:general stress protein 26